MKKTRPNYATTSIVMTFSGLLNFVSGWSGGFYKPNEQESHFFKRIDFVFGWVQLFLHLLTIRVWTKKYKKVTTKIKYFGIEIDSRTVEGAKILIQCFAEPLYGYWRHVLMANSQMKKTEGFTNLPREVIAHIAEETLQFRGNFQPLTGREVETIRLNAPSEFDKIVEQFFSSGNNENPLNIMDWLQ
jgi:hypothetical protein